MALLGKIDLKTLVLICVLAYVATLVFLYVAQRSMTYFPDSSFPVPSVYGLSETEELQVTTEDGLSLRGWYQPPSDPDKGVVIMFHGNAGHAGFRAFKAHPFLDEGYGFLLTHYRGYGGSEGKPTEQGLYKDAEAYINYVLNQPEFTEDDLVLYGESLGTGVAVEMSRRYPRAKALILETPYTALPDVAQVRFPVFPVKFLMKDRFNSISKIGGVTMPVIILHGKFDMVVPFRLGKKLYEAANEPKKFVSYSTGSHNNLYSYGAGEHILSFLRELDAQERLSHSE